jgi:hypothetical protein
MPGKRPNNLKTPLALALAQGSTATAWGRTNGVSKQTACRWARDPALRATVESIRRRGLDRAIGCMAQRANSAVDQIAALGDSAASESVQLGALRAILSDMMAESKYAGLEARMAEIEEQLQEGRSDATRPG